MNLGTNFFIILTVGVSFLLANPVAAQIFTNLYSFTATWPDRTNSDGANPHAALTLSGSGLYGTATVGGNLGFGTVFKINTDGTGFTNIYNFSGSTNGSMPIGGVTLLGNTLYGTTYYGGSTDSGMIFEVHADGSGFTNLHSFSVGSDGARPQAGLAISGNTLYGTALGGSLTGGTIFKINADGTGFTNIYNFTGGNDGRGPNALIIAGNILYGATGEGGSSNNGVVFRLNADGSGFTNLHSFNPSKDGSDPQGSLVISSNTLYGTAYQGGKFGNGTIFSMNTDGSSFTNLHDFTGGYDGGDPFAGLTLFGHTLYGTASSDSISGNGTLFGLNTDGTGFTVVHTFSNGLPYATLILSDNTLFGTTYEGGSFDYGTIFSFNVIPHLTMTLSEENLIVSWPTNSIGFSLQSNTNLASQTGWTTVSPTPVVVNGQNVVTNPIFGKGQFYRLVY